MRSQRPPYVRLLPVTVVACASLALSGCGAVLDRVSGDDETSSPSPTAAGSSASQAQGGSIDLEDVEAATIQIVAEGTFIDPEFGEQTNSAGAGSGFIIDPEGIAVTNNHVVTGAAFLEVFVGGSTDPVNARVLGVSECSDLAVIDLDGGDYPSLRWSNGSADAGLDVYAAGFPLGDPEFTLTRGIISKAEAGGETNWASVDSVLEHDATINPGNSGGPLVDDTGAVVGVNYAGNSETRQQFAIASSEAQTIVEQLRAEEDVTSLGINGQAIFDETSGTTGVWVASVESGTPADTVGIEPGDIVTQLENINIATEGDMSEYCDVLRSRTLTDVLQVEVLRYATSEVLEGQFNGDPLVPVTSFAQELGGGEDGTATGGDATYGEYVSIQDDTGAVSVDVPAEWSDIDGAPYTGEDGIDRVDVRAAPSLEAFAGGWDTPGMILTASSGLAASSTPEAVLDQLGASGSEVCTYEGRQPYEDQLYSGVYDIFTNCGGTAATYVIVSAAPADGSFIVSVQVQANAERDYEAIDRILSTFVVTGSV